jgi:hypothetical protein
MHVDCRLALSQLRDHGGQHGQESEESKEGKEDRQEEKEVTVRQKLHEIRITPEVRCALHNAGQAAASPTEYPSNKPSGRTLMQMAAA